MFWWPISAPLRIPRTMNTRTGAWAGAGSRSRTSHRHHGAIIGHPLLSLVCTMRRRFRTGATALIDGYNGLLLDRSPKRGDTAQYSRTESAQGAIAESGDRAAQKTKSTTGDGRHIVLSAEHRAARGSRRGPRHGARKESGLVGPNYSTRTRRCSRPKKNARDAAPSRNGRGGPLITRTLDLGRQTFRQHREGGGRIKSVPLLFRRAIRVFALENPTIFKAHRRGILRASVAK